MELNNILVVGLGQCGCRITDGFKSLNPELTPIYINSSEYDMLDCKHIRDYNKHIFNGADGSGKDINKALEFIIEDKPRLLSFLDKFSQFKYMLVVSSLGGGTGAGTLTEFCRIVKETYDIKVGVLAIMPSLTEDKLSLDNALTTLKELSSNKFLELVDSVTVANNGKVKGGNYSKINRQIIKGFSQALTLTTDSREERIDTSDLSKVFLNNKGYLSILPMPEYCDSIEESLLEARENNIFVCNSEDMECGYGAIVLNEEYNLKEVASLINSDETLFKSHDKEDPDKNMILLGGCSFPRDIINDLRTELRTRNAKKVERKLGLDDEEFDIDERKKKIMSSLSENGNSISRNRRRTNNINKILDDEDIDF